MEGRELVERMENVGGRDEGGDEAEEMEIPASYGPSLAEGDRDSEALAELESCSAVGNRERDDSVQTVEVSGPGAQAAAREVVGGEDRSAGGGLGQITEIGDGVEATSGLSEAGEPEREGTGVDVADVETHIGQARETDVEMTVRMVKAVEDDARAVAESLSILFSSLQSALSEVTESTVEHMRCHSEAAGLLQGAAIDAATKGNRFVNACLRLNQEMKTMGNLAAQLKTLRQVVDQFEYHASRYIPRP